MALQPYGLLVRADLVGVNDDRSRKLSFVDGPVSQDLLDLIRKPLPVICKELRFAGNDLIHIGLHAGEL